MSPDAHFVAYVADGDADDVDELYVVPVGGGSPRKLNPPLVEGGDVNRFPFVFTPDSSQMRVLGGSSTKLNMPITLGGGGDSGIYSEWAVNPVSAPTRTTPTPSRATCTAA